MQKCLPESVFGSIRCSFCKTEVKTEVVSSYRGHVKFQQEIPRRRNKKDITAKQSEYKWLAEIGWNYRHQAYDFSRFAIKNKLFWSIFLFGLYFGRTAKWKNKKPDNCFLYCFLFGDTKVKGNFSISKWDRIHLKKKKKTLIHASFKFLIHPKKGQHDILRFLY